jgi:hypothetical protein
MQHEPKSKLEQVLEIVQKEPNYENFEYKGYYCVIKRMMYLGGQLNGYVRIPENHEYYDKDYSWIPYDLPIECHGGITFSGELEGETGYYIGFDCAHAWDYMPFLQMQLPSSTRFMEHDPTITYKDINYVRNQCKDIVDQLISIQEKQKRK